MNSQAGTSYPATKLVLLPSKKFQHAAALYYVSAIRLPREQRAISEWSVSQGDPALLDEESEDFAHEELDHGMGKMRLSLLKMGCRVNVHAPFAVS